MDDHLFKLPNSEAELKALMDKLRSLREQKSFAIALALCQHMIIHQSTRMAGYRARSDTWSAMSEHDLALHDLQKLAASGSVEPADHYELGIALLRRTEAKEAVSAFTKAIELGEQHDFHYYTQPSRFHRAAAYLRLGMLNEALDDCSKIEDGFSCYLPSQGMRNKEDLVAEARKQM